MKVYAITNQKGGVAKTTTAVNLSSILNMKGYKTLLIDADQQTNSTDIFRAKVEGEATLYDCWLEDKESRIDINECIQHTEIGDIVSGDALLSKVEEKLQGNAEWAYSFADMLYQLKGYDIVVIDCPPAISMTTKAVLGAATNIIIPATADRHAILGLSQIWEIIEQFKKRINPQLSISGILLVKFNTRTNLNKDVYLDLKEISKTMGTTIFKSYIRETVKVREATVNQDTLVNYAPKCTAYKDYIDFVEELLRK